MHIFFNSSCLQYFDPADQGRKYAFKCHRRQVQGTEVVYPINALAFHPVYVNTWLVVDNSRTFSILLNSFYTTVAFLTVVWANLLSYSPCFYTHSDCRYGTFATGGCDGVVNYWDGENKKRLSLPMQYPTSIASLAMNGMWWREKTFKFFVAVDDCGFC